MANAVRQPLNCLCIRVCMRLSKVEGSDPGLCDDAPAEPSPGWSRRTHLVAKILPSPWHHVKATHGLVSFRTGLVRFGHQLPFALFSLFFPLRYLNVTGCWACKRGLHKTPPLSLQLAIKCSKKEYMRKKKPCRLKYN